MARSKKLTDEQNKARAREQSHTYRHRSNNLPARTANRAARLAAQWVQENYPQQWGAFIRQAKKEEQEKIDKGSTYTPHSVRYATDTCPHDKVKAVGIMRQCQNCGELLGAWPVENPSNREMLQDILEAEDGA